MKDTIIKCVLFNLGETSDSKRYEELLKRKQDGEVIFLEQEKNWGKRVEDTLYVFVAYQVEGLY